jgi:peptidyl-prolyl cis-trans isomerase D
MLQFLRGTVGSWVVKILFILLIISFGIWGIGDMFRKGGGSSAVASVGPVEIGRVELDHEFRRQMERLRPMLGGSLTAEQARQFGLLDQALSGLIQRSLYDLAASDLGLVIGTGVVRQHIAQEPAFRNQAGRFDAGQFHRVLQANNLTEAGYSAVMRRDIARGLLAQAVSGGAVAPKPVVDELYRWREEKRTADIVTLPHAGISDIGTPDDAGLVRWYEDHAVRFTAPEYRTVTLAQLSLDDMARDVNVADEQLRAAFDERASEFQAPERRTLDTVVVADEGKAKALAQAARQAGGLAKAAKAAGEQVLPLDRVTRDELPEIGDAAFALPAGGISDPLPSGLGWHIVGVTAVEPATTRTFDDVRDELLTTLRRDKAADQLFQVSGRLDDTLASGASLDEAAQKHGLRMTRLDMVDASGQKPDGTPATGVKALAEVVKVAFATAAGTTSRMTESAGGDLFALRVDKVVAPAVRPLADVRADAIAGWQDEQRATRAAALAEDIATRLRASPAVDVPDAIAGSGAAKAGVSSAITTPFTRQGQTVSGLTPELVGKLFAAKAGEVVTGSSGKAEVVARVREIVPADPAAAGAATATLANSVAQGVGADLLAEYGQALQQTHPVMIYRQRIEQMYGDN